MLFAQKQETTVNGIMKKKQSTQLTKNRANNKKKEN